MIPRIVCACIDFGYAITLILIALPLVYRKIPMNRFYGFRIPKAFVSDENWYAVNAFGGRQLILWSLLLLATGAAKFFLPIEDMDAPLAPIVMLGPVIGVSTGAIIRTLIFAASL